MLPSLLPDANLFMRALRGRAPSDAQEGNLDVVKFLARNEIDMSQGKNGISPFHMACYRGHLDVVT